MSFRLFGLETFNLVLWNSGIISFIVYCETADVCAFWINLEMKKSAENT